MKLRGEFVVRQILDDTVAIPVGATALTLNGMILLNAVSAVIWEKLEQDTDVAALTAAVTERFSVCVEEARTDVMEFLQKLRDAQLLEE